jgi:hypothetical protein
MPDLERTFDSAFGDARWPASIRKDPKVTWPTIGKPEVIGPPTHFGNHLQNPRKIPPVNNPKKNQALRLAYPQVVRDNAYAGPAAQNLAMMQKIAEGGRKFPGTCRKKRALCMPLPIIVGIHLEGIIFEI